MPDSVGTCAIGSLNVIAWENQQFADLYGER
jgi:hypothetical protein